VPGEKNSERKPKCEGSKQGKVDVLLSRGKENSNPSTKCEEGGPAGDVGFSSTAARGGGNLVTPKIKGGAGGTIMI